MKIHNLQSTDFDMDEIISIELIGEKETVDITVEDTHMFFANDVYSHNSALEDDIIEADKIAASYGKVMVSDFIMSLSRKVQDKLSGTGRVHIVKNRFGPDGMTLPSKINTNNGQFQFFEPDTSQGKATKKDMKSGETMMKKNLSEKFKDLGGSLG